jgi:RNA 2',3'-cyclic 3'-phosphodiesterase
MTDSQPLRLFFAVDIPPTPALAAIVEPLERWPMAVRQVPAAQWHLTVRFLGDTEPERVPELCAAAEGIAAGISPFALPLGGVGTFSMRGRWSVVWIGVEVHHDELETAAVAFGFLPDQRPFRPHLTIGRFKSAPPPQMRKWLDVHRDTPCGMAQVDSVKFIRSQLTPQGSVHEPVKTWALGVVPAGSSLRASPRSR